MNVYMTGPGRPAGGTPRLSRASSAVFFALFVAVFLPPIYREWSGDISWKFSAQGGISAARGGDPLYEEDYVNTEGFTRSVHCPTVVSLRGGNLLAVWYGGTREGAPDVALYQSVWDRGSGAWSTPCRLMDAGAAGADLGRYVRKMGNAVLCEDGRGRVWLFFVTVSLGGWSGSSINYSISEDDGCHWSRCNRLVTSPLLNMGTLVRGTPLRYKDGSLGVPAYSELWGKRGQLIRIASDGTVLDRSRITWGRTFLQPSVVPLDADHAVAFLRNSGEKSRRIFDARSSDGGGSWSYPHRMDLPNPDSAVMGLDSGEGDLLLVFNNMMIDRDDISLARSADRGKSWRVIHEFEKASPSEWEEIDGFSYPFLIRAPDGVFHLLYTWNRRRIKHVYFNMAWLKGLG